MKIVTIQIDSCTRCPHYIEVATFDGREYCGMTQQHFIRDQPIPNWCPLPNEEETWIAKIKQRFSS
jgi:hypothetical protein